MSKQQAHKVCGVITCQFPLTGIQRLCLCAPHPPLSVSPSLSLSHSLSLPLSSLYRTQARSSKQSCTQMLKAHNALYCLVLTFEYLNGVF